MRRWLPLLPVAVALALGACGGGGCGEGPASNGELSPEEKRRQQQQVRDAGKKTGGQVEFSGFDSKNWNESAHATGRSAAAGRRPARPLGPPRVDWLESVAPAQWESQVLSGSALVMVAEADCEDCGHAGAALKSLEERFPEWRFRRLDFTRPEAPALLPAGIKRVPSFLIYQGGKATSRLQGLPFPQVRDEPQPEYRLRLKRWFRDALIQKDLAFNKPR